MSHHFLLSILVSASLLVFPTATRAAAVTDLKKIVLGNAHGCGITHAGALRCFGNNNDGQLGTEQRLSYSFAKYGVTVLPSGVTDVAISDQHTCAVVNSTLSCWGSNQYGQLGTGETGSNIKTPTKVSAIAGKVMSVVAGGDTTCAILAPNGSLQCWGRNDLGQVGNGSAEQKVLQPATVIPSGVTAVAIGGQHTCAVVNGGLQCWGFLLFKEERFITTRKPISIIPAGQGATAVAAALHTCVIVKESLQCWGRNFHNQVGVIEGSRVAPKVPTTIIASGVTTMALSDENTCAVANGALMCWGWNNNAQLGSLPSQGSSTPTSVPVPEVPPAAIRSVTVGMRQVCVLTGTSATPDNSLLQCTNRAPDPEDVDGTEPPTAHDQWLGFGTEGVGLAEPPPVLPRIARYGLWQGTIGTQQVMVQLTPSAQACDARYYYRKHLWSIALTEKERRQGKEWKESQGSDNEATWMFSALSPDGSTLTGEWISRDGLRRLPIRLDLLTLTPVVERENEKTSYDCYFHNKAFDTPRIARARQERAVAPSDTLFQGTDGSYRYRQVSVLGGQIQGFTLPDIKRTPRLQQMLEAWESESVSQFYDCAAGFAGSYNATAPDFHRELTPQFWNARLLVLSESYSNYCGGAHPSGGLSAYHTWDLVADRPIKVWAWIKGSNSGWQITSKRLLDLVAANYSRRNESGSEGCANALEGNEFYLLSPSTAGMVFSPSLAHAIRSCEEDIVIPWAKMRPFLSPAGKKAVDELFPQTRAP